MKIILAQSRHIEAVAEVYCLAFENSITFFTPMTQKIKNAITDIFFLLYQVFGRGFMVAVKDDEVCGYIVMADDVKKLWIKALTSGYLLRAAVSVISGEYGLTLPTLYKIAKNKLFYLRFEMSTQPCAQLLSIAVCPKYHGEGIGQKLVTTGMKYIESLGVSRIKLEARPDNTPAIRLYKKFGFQIKGETKDLQGKWLIMVRET